MRIAMMLALTLAACTAPTYPPSGALGLQPGHWTTGVASTSWPSLFVLWDGGGPDGPHLVLGYLPHAELHRFGETAPFEPDDSGRLPIGWYTAVVTLADDEVGHLTIANAVAESTTRYVSDFHVGSAPLALVSVVAGILNDAPVQLVELRLSEPCVASASPLSLVHVQVDGHASACSAVPDTSAEDLLAGGHALRLTCAEGIASGASVVVDIAPGITSTTGVPLRDLDGHTDVHVALVAGVVTTPRVSVALAAATDP